MSRDSSRYTGLILVSGIDTPGITQALFETLSPFAITVLDIEQVVIRERLILTVLFDLNPDHALAIEEDLNICAERLGVDIATSFQVQEVSSIAVKTGLLHVVAMGSPLSPRAIAVIANEIAALSGNIERIHRTASYPVTAIEFVGTGKCAHRPAAQAGHVVSFLAQWIFAQCAQSSRDAIARRSRPVRIRR